MEHDEEVLTIQCQQNQTFLLYTDDTLLYISFTPTNSALSLESLTTTFTCILSCMNLNKLFLNPSKTEWGHFCELLFYMSIDLTTSCCNEYIGEYIENQIVVYPIDLVANRQRDRILFLWYDCK